MGPVPEFSRAASIARYVLPELGEGEIPVFIDVNTIEIPAKVMHVISMISIINIMSGIVYDIREDFGGATEIDD